MTRDSITELARETREQNALPIIDVTEARTLEELRPERKRKSQWVDKVNQLVKEVKTGAAEYDRYYKIGSWNAPSGASSTLKILGERANELIAVDYDFQCVPTRNEGRRGSELWCAVLKK